MQCIRQDLERRVIKDIQDKRTFEYTAGRKFVQVKVNHNFKMRYSIRVLL